MRCPACGTEGPPTAKFCAECGTRLANTCSRCGHEADPAAKFCQECGSPLGVASNPTASTSTTLPPPPRDYTPPHLAQRILADRAALEGERKQVTVLFADIKGSTELIQALDAEEAQGLLDGAVRVMMDAVHRYEGTVSRAMGDGLMALFGAPIAHEDHAIRACHAALAIQDGMRRYGAAASDAHGVDVEARVGINSGEAIIRLISDDLHMDYTAMGPTVHLAARMEQAAAGGSIRLTAETFRLAEGYVQVRPLGAVPVRGLAEPVEAFELVGAGSARGRLDAAAGRDLTRLAGRRDELEAVRRALGRATDGHGQVVALVGEPGVGKSRVVWEITHAQTVRGWTVLSSGAVSYGKATPYLPIVELLRAYFGVEAGQEPGTVRERLAASLAESDRESSLAPILALLDVAVDDPEWDALDPSQRRGRTLDAVKWLLLRESRERPLLLVFEDLHWVDSETQAVLDDLVEALPARPVVLLVNHRPEYRHGWGGKTYYTQLRIDPLPPESASALLDSLLGADASVERLKALLVERTQGTPLFLEESVRALVETGALVGERGGYRLEEPLANVRMPATVQAVLAARIDRLSTDDKRLLQTAAVIGMEVPLALLRTVADLQEEELRARLAALRAAEFLYEAGLHPDSEYAFKHALTHEVAYGSLLRERRRELHGRVVEALERLFAERLNEQVERLAHHALSAEDWDKALEYARKAGARAMSRYAYSEAAIWHEQALEVLGRLPESDETLEQTIDLRLGIRTALAPLGATGRILGHLREAEILAERLGDRRRLGWIWSATTNSCWVLGRHDEGIGPGRRAAEAGSALRDLPLLIAARFNLGLANWGRGDNRQALEYFKENIATLEGANVSSADVAASPSMNSHSAVNNRTNAAWASALLGDFARGAAYGEEALRIAESIDHPYSLTLALFLTGGLHLLQGNATLAIPLLERAVHLCETGDFPFFFAWSAARLGAAYTLDGRVDEGVQLLERAVAFDSASETRAEASLRVTWLGEAYLSVGRVPEAASTAMRALDLARAHGERANHAWALHLRARTAAQHQPPELDAAERHFRESLRDAESLGLRPLQAHCHLGLGNLYRRTGKREQAQEHLTTATTMYREMDMRFWLEQAEAISRALA